MGDVVGLVERAQAEFDAADAEKFSQKLAKNSFDLQDFLDQIKMMKKLGPLQNLLGMIPGMPKIPDSVDGEKSLRRVEAMIRSMTPGERSRPGILNARRRQRIARAAAAPAFSGTQRTDASVRRDEENDAAANPRWKPGKNAAWIDGQALERQGKFMAVIIRLRRDGTKNSPSYRIVVWRTSTARATASSWS